MTKSKTSSRIHKLQRALKQSKVGALFVEAPVDLFYLTGLQLSLGHLIVTQGKACLFVDGRYKEAAEKTAPCQTDELDLDKKAAFLKGVKLLGFDGDRMSYTDYTNLRKLARKAGAKLKSHPEFLKELRLIKEPGEIRKMQESAKFAYKAYEYIRKKVRPGVTEQELAKQLELYCLKNGASAMSFEPIIAFGKNSALPHHHPGKTKCRENEIILFDLGVMLDGYASDMTRVDFLGKVDPKLRHLHDVNKAAQRMALSKARPGVTLKELDVAARRVMKSAGLEEYFVHSLGHGVGLEIHEAPRIASKGADRNQKLQEGMVITIEPGLYLPGKGGVRYEDTIVITPKGYRNLYPE
jgi:Xaa-Pro aminopeptidase